MTAPLQLSPEVADALRQGLPVVALESTIIAHGMAWPKNVEVAFSVERIVRDGGAIPATIAILDGRLRVGLGQSEIEHLGKAGAAMLKVSTRDLAYAVARKIDGATT